ncbi:MAG: hypothetical protein H8E34_06290, partial [Bacteroidetes bacterium]|nr:hypothetical protein [Bacteroidota bacterium]
WHKASIIENDSLEITMVVPEQVYNPVSGSNVTNGDAVPLYSYVCDTGLWIFDRWAKITDTLFSGLYVTAKTSRLQNFNFSWFENNDCNHGSNFEISGSCQQCNSIMIDGVVRKQADNSFISVITLAAQWDGPITIPFSTGGTPVYIEWGVSSECNYCYVDPAVSPLLIDDMCSQQSIPLPLNDDSPVSKTIIVNFVGSCVSDTNYIILPSFGLWIRPVDATCWRWTSMKNGIAKICNVVYNQTYVVGTYYNGIWQEWVITITEENYYTFEIEFSQSVCSGVFGIL